MNFQGFVGPTYNLKSSNVDAQRCVNLFPEIIESGTGKEAQIAYLKSTPGLEKLFTANSGPIRLVHVDSIGNIFVISGNTVRNASYSGGVWTVGTLGTVSTTTGIMKAASAQLGSDAVTVFVDGTANYAYLKTTGYPAGYFGTFGGFGYPGVPTATHVAFIDNYFIFNQAGTNQFFVSDFNSFSVSPLSFASSEGDPDNIVAIIANRRDLWLLNERTTEIYVNTGNADFPFERISGGFIEKGCTAKFSVAKIEGYVFWLGRDEFGQGVVYASQSLNPQRISTHAVEAAIKGYADMTTATAFTYQSGGHSFYVLNFAEGTWVYDVSTKLWHERAYTGESSLERHRADVHAYCPALGIHIVGDYANNKVYKYNDDYYYDDTQALTRLRSTPHVSSELKRIFCSSFQLDAESGVGLDGIAQGTDPQIMLDWSDDGGHTWSNEHWKSLGKIGEYKTRIIWRRLGVMRDRVFRVKITDPVKVTFLSAQIELAGSGS